MAAYAGYKLVKNAMIAMMVVTIAIILMIVIAGFTAPELLGFIESIAAIYYMLLFALVLYGVYKWLTSMRW